MTKLPVFDGVDEISFNSVMRRSIVVHFVSRFIDETTLDKVSTPAENGAFLNLHAKNFARSGPAVAASWQLLHAHMADISEAQAIAKIEAYVDDDGRSLTRL